MFVLLRYGRRLNGELTTLHDTAQRMAGRRLPDVVERLRKGEDVDVDAESPPPPPGTITEIARVAQAFATVQRTAVQAAVGQANLRKGVNQVFLNLSLRNQSLLHRQLGMLDSMERATGDPAVLADLFRLDHLTTRMRRHAEGLIILSGSTPGRGWRDPVPVVDVLRAAIAEVEDYVRVNVASESHDAVVGAAVNDVIHLVAELIENATTFSPPATRVEVRADVVGTGFAVEIEDRGLGLSAGELADINEQLASPPEFDLDSSDRLGLFVVGQLAARHGIRVSLRESPYGGTTAIVLMPHSIIVRAGEVATARDTPGPGLAPAPGRGWPASTGAPGPEPAGQEPAGRQGQPAGRVGAGPAANGERGSVFSLTGRQRSGAPRPAGPDPDPPAGPHPTWAPAPPAAPAEPLTSAPPAQELPRRAQTAAGTHRGLPRRVRQANLAPQLRTGAQNGTSPTAHRGADITARSPEENRDLMSALQQGWQRGRLDDLEDPAAARDVLVRRPAGPGGGSERRGGSLMTEESTAGQLSWLLDNLAGRVEHVRQAVILSRDGLVVATSQNMSREDGDHLSALAAGVQSLARGAGRHFSGGEVRQTIIEMESAFLFVMAAGQGTCLAVVASADANVGVMAYEMAMLVRRMGRHLTAGARFPDHEPATG